ncbi:hypothetical protein F5Y13DRAFT_113302 [Hypoxylon sp. FL1857]|nr:hypothetical protein F5Y13DRAFT_113302 [Hypoxylon sp. FL1857]
MSTRSELGTPSRRHWQFTEDGDSDEDVEMTSLPSSPADDSSENSKTSQNYSSGGFSEPLTMRISGSEGRPLFPTSMIPLRPKSTEMADTTTLKDAFNSFSLSESEGGIQKKRVYKYESMAQMIDLHVEELKKRQPLGGPNGCTEKRSEGGGGSQGGWGNATSK